MLLESTLLDNFPYFDSENGFMNFITVPMKHLVWNDACVIFYR